MIKFTVYLFITTLCSGIVLAKSLKLTTPSHILEWYTFTTIISTVLAIDGVHIAVDQWLGLNNFAWLLSYLVLIAGTYVLFANLWKLFDKPVSITATIWFIAFFTGCIVIYWVHIRHTPEWPAHDYPRSFGDFAFMQLMYIGILYFALIPYGGFYAFWQLSKPEQNLPTRWRFNILFIYGLLATLSFVLKSFATSVAYVFGPILTAEWLLKLSHLCFGLTAFCWALALMPRQGFITLIAIHRYIEQLILFYDLQKLANSLGQLVPERPLNQDILQALKEEPLWKQWTLSNLEFRAKRLVVGINDSRRDFLLQEGNHKTYPKIYQLLNQIPDGVSLHESSQIYQQISRQWKGI